jgi:hypothetical protein
MAAAAGISTYLTYCPDISLPKLLGWLDRLTARVELPLYPIATS